MPTYEYNKNCSCKRCHLHGLMGAAMIITTGVLGLFHVSHVFYFQQSWPIYMLVVGAMVLLIRTASTEGHIPRMSQIAMAPPPIAYTQPTYAQQTWAGSTAGATAPPPPTMETSGTNPDNNHPDQQVKS